MTSKKGTTMEVQNLQEASVDKLIKWLMKDEGDFEAIEAEKDKKLAYIAERIALSNPQQEIYDDGIAICRLFTDYNIFWKMAKIKLYKDLHPAFYQVGKGKARKILWNGHDVGMRDEDVHEEIIDTMIKIKHLFDFNWSQGNRKGKGGKGKTPEEAIAQLALVSEDNQIQRYFSKQNGLNLLLEDDEVEPTAEDLFKDEE